MVHEHTHKRARLSHLFSLRFTSEQRSRAWAPTTVSELFSRVLIRRVPDGQEPWRTYNAMRAARASQHDL